MTVKIKQKAAEKIFCKIIDASFTDILTPGISFANMNTNTKFN